LKWRGLLALRRIQRSHKIASPHIELPMSKAQVLIVRAGPTGLVLPRGATGSAGVLHAISLCFAAQDSFQPLNFACKLSQSWSEFQAPRDAEMSTGKASGALKRDFKRISKQVVTVPADDSGILE
jgi:hypothetical protein